MAATILCQSDTGVKGRRCVLRGHCHGPATCIYIYIWPVKTEGEEASPWMPRATTSFAGGNHRLMKRALGAAEGEVAAGGKGAGPVPLEGVNSK